MIPIRPQAGPAARGDDASCATLDVFPRASHLKIFKRSGSSVTADESGPGRGRPSGFGLYVFGRDPNEAHARRAERPRGRGARNCRRRRLSSGAASSASRAARKIAGSGFSAPTRQTIRHDAEEGSETRSPAHRFEITVEVRHDAQPAVFAQFFEDRSIASENGRHVRQETRDNALAAIARRPAP